MPKSKNKSKLSQAKQNNLVYWVIGAVLVVLIALFAAKVFVKPPMSDLTAYDNLSVSPPISVRFTEFSSLYHAVGAGTSNNLPVYVKDAPALQTAGKTKIVYVGADYCPYCAAERWALILSLSRFGAFSNLHYMTSSATDAYPSTPTFTFYKATYQSPFLAFQSAELTGNVQKQDGTYPPIQKPTPEQVQLLNKYDATPYTNNPGAIPFVDIGGKYLMLGSGYDPGLLKGLQWNQVLDAAQQPGTPINQALLGSANAVTAAICASDGEQPASVCNDQALRTVLAAFSQK